MEARLRALCDVFAAQLREDAGLHEYDGTIQDLSVAGLRAALTRLGGAPLADPHDEAHLAAFEAHARLMFGELELHRRLPHRHLANLDLACYDRQYAPKAERDAAKHAHLQRWPDAVDIAIQTLDAVPAPVAGSLLSAVRGLAAGVDPTDDAATAALAAHGRLVDHLEQAAKTGPPEAAIGSAALAALMGTAEATRVDLGRLAEQADAERDRLTRLLREACARIEPDADVRAVVAALVAQHPDADGVIAQATAQVEEVLTFTREHDLVPYTDGECVVAPAPPSRRWAMAMMVWAAPGEPDAPSCYWVTPPDPSWPADQVEAWLQVFSDATLPAITLHEVSPGHFAHSRALRRAPSAVRRLLASSAFVEGWAHYVEELALDLGFRDGDPRFAAGVAIEALVRVTRLAAAIGVHTGAMDVDEAAARFEADAFLTGSAASAEARRSTFDPTYGRYTWGKLAIGELRDKARRRWGDGYSHKRFHSALFELGSPPLGLLGTALERG
jgi:hypothetical protein